MNRSFVSALVISAILSSATARDITNLISDKDSLFAIPEAALPEKGVWFEDPVFETKIKRITDAAKHRIPVYSKTQPWNADESRMILYQQGQGHVLYDGQTYEEIGAINFKSNGNTYPAGDLENIWWHPTDPDVLIYPSTPNVKPNTPCIVRNNIETGEIEVLREFPEFTGSDNWAFGAMGEGNLSHDASMIAVMGKTESGEKMFCAYDIENDVKYEHKPITEQSVSSYGPDWVSISPSGKYIVINADIYGVYDLNMNLIHTIDIPGGHADMAIDLDGEDVIVLVDHDSPQAPRIAKVRLSDGKITDLLNKADDVSWAFSGTHISCRNTDLPGWAYISTVKGWGTSAPFYREIYRVKMDGSKTVGRIAHHRSSGDPYWSEPHVAVNRDGTKMIWGSNWGSSSNMSQTYLCDISTESTAAAIAPTVKQRSLHIQRSNWNSLHLSLPHESIRSIRLYTLQGKELYSSSDLRGDNAHINHNLALASGVYLVSVVSETATHSLTVTVQ